MNNIKRILIVGNGRAGKDTAAMYLAKLTKIPYAGSTSWAAKEIVAKKLGVHPQEAWENRHANREKWKSICDVLRSHDQTLLIRLALAVANENKSAGLLAGWRGIVVGVRDHKEIDAAKQQKLFDRIIWIANPRVPVDSTVTFGAQNCDEIIWNKGTIMDFRLTLFGWAEHNGLIPSFYLSGKPPTDDQFRE
jgi:hypothetical protein